MYPLVYGDDIDGIADEGIPENDTSDTSYHIVSINLVLRYSSYSPNLDAKTRTKG